MCIKEEIEYQSIEEREETELPNEIEDFKKIVNKRFVLVPQMQFGKEITSYFTM